MPRHRRHRLKTVLVMVACLLWQQLALASLVCTMPAAAVGPADLSAHCAQMTAHERATSVASDIDMAMPGDLAALCAKHCSPDQTTAASQVVGSVPALLLPAPIHLACARAMSCAIDHVDDDRLARSDPPPRLRYCSLLI